MQNHVPTKENCEALDKALKAKGMKPMETMFHWVHSKTGWKLHYGRTKKQILQMLLVGNDVIPAPLVSEFGERLPFGYATMQSGSMFKKAKWVCGQVGIEGNDQFAPTEADARCLLLTYLINEGLIS